MESNVLTAIGTVGFPIVMCLLQFWQTQTTMKDVTQALNNNTSVMHALANEMSVIKNDKA